MKLTDLILELPGFLPEEDCEDFVEKFWNNTNKHHDGGIGDGDVDYTHKKATQWHPQVGNDIWCQLSVVVNNAIDEYYKRSKLLWRAPLVSYDYSLRCYVKNDGWFNEQVSKQAATAVSRAIAAGKTKIEVNFPPVPNVEGKI